MGAGGCSGSQHQAMTLDKSSTKCLFLPHPSSHSLSAFPEDSVHWKTSPLLSLLHLLSHILTFRQHALKFKTRSPFLPSTQQPVPVSSFPSSLQIKPMTMENGYGLSFVPLSPQKTSQSISILAYRENTGESRVLKNPKFRSQGWESEIPWEASVRLMWVDSPGQGWERGVLS